MLFHEKICNICNESKSLQDFPKYKNTVRNKCRKCFNEYNRLYQEKYRLKNQPYIKNYNNNPDNKRKHRNRVYLKKYDITLEQYNQMFEEQGGKCAICGKHQSESKKAFAVDHCHETGMVRGLLCSDCNLGLGKFLDSPTLLERAVSYLKTF